MLFASWLQGLCTLLRNEPGQTFTFLSACAVCIRRVENWKKGSTCAGVGRGRSAHMSISMTWLSLPTDRLFCILKEQMQEGWHQL